MRSTLTRVLVVASVHGLERVRHPRQAALLPGARPSGAALPTQAPAESMAKQRQRRSAPRASLAPPKARCGAKNALRCSLSEQRMPPERSEGCSPILVRQPRKIGWSQEARACSGRRRRRAIPGATSVGSSSRGIGSCAFAGGSARRRHGVSWRRNSARSSAKSSRRSWSRAFGARAQSWSGEGAVSRGIERRAGLRPPQPGRVGAAGACRGLGRCAEEGEALASVGSPPPSWPNNRLQQAAANRGVQVSVGAGRSSA